MMRYTLTLLLFLYGLPAIASPQLALAAALEDCKTLSPGVRENTRYLWQPISYDATQRAVFAFHCNSLSREAELVPPRRVNNSLLAVNLLDYGWNRQTWDKFADTEPYFMVRIVADRYFYTGGNDAQGKHWPAGWYQNKSKAIVPAFAPWLDQQTAADLITLTQSQSPILRAEWFFSQTAIQENRKVGYYGMLGLGNKLADFDELVGLDRKRAQKARKEVASIVSVSSVALHNRQIYRFGTLNGAYWETRDAKQNTDDRNAIRLLNGDYKFDAHETYGTLPNGLFAFFLSDANGVRANTAPDFIASDGRSNGTDRRVHVGLSCIRCHVPGIQPIDDWSRRLYTGALRLDVTDAQRYIRLRQLYLSDLQDHIETDQTYYAKRLKKTNGLTPGDNAKAYAAYWDAYNEVSLTPGQAATELGTTEAKLLAGIREKVQAGLFDPVLAGFLQQPPLPIRRDHWEELQPIIWQALGNKP